MTPAMTWANTHAPDCCPASLFGRRGGDGNLARFGLIAHAWCPDVGFLGFRAGDLRYFLAVRIAGPVALLAAALPAALVTVHLTGTGSLALLRGGLSHQVQHTKVMLGVLKIAFRHDAVAATRGITAELQIFLKQLLRGAANPNVRSIAVEDVVPIHRNAATLVVTHTAAAATASSATTA
jgi:hypothetical protein